MVISFRAQSVHGCSLWEDPKKSRLYEAKCIALFFETHLLQSRDLVTYIVKWKEQAKEKPERLCGSWKLRVAKNIPSFLIPKERGKPQ